MAGREKGRASISISSASLKRKIQRTSSSKFSTLRRSTSRSNTDFKKYAEEEKAEKEFKRTPLREPPTPGALDFDDKDFDPLYYAESIFSSHSVSEIPTVLSNLAQDERKCSIILQKDLEEYETQFIESTPALRRLAKDIAALGKLMSEENMLLLDFEKKSKAVTAPMKQKSRSKAKAEPLAHWETTCSQFDSLDILMSERRLDQCVDILETFLQSKKEQTFRERSQTRKYVAQLSSLLCKEIQRPYITKVTLERLISNLIRLNEAGAARNAFLQLQTDKVNFIIKNLRLDEDIKQTITVMSETVFSSIVATLKDYQVLFDNSNSLSTFVLWATQLIDFIGNIFSRDVFLDPLTRKACVKIVQVHAKVQLAKNNLPLSFHISSKLK